MTNGLKRLLPPRTTTLEIREIPSAILRAALWGAIFGPPIAVFLAWLFQAEVNSADRDWIASLPQQAFVGMIYAVVFYGLCAVPTGYVRRTVQSVPPRVAALFVNLTGVAGAVLAFGLTAALVPRTAGGRQELRVMIVMSLLAVGIAVAVSAWDRGQVEKALAHARARSHVLQAQINPHFFFNTLNTVSALIPINPPEAQRTLGLLADMSRYAFAGAEAHLVPLARELEFATSYLEIERVRFGARLRTELPDAASVEGLSLPALTLQPLIENAVRHGIARRVEGGAISVQVQRTERAFSVIVQNDGDSVGGLSSSAFFQPGHALANIRERLRLVYNGDAGASVDVSFPRAGRVAVVIHAPVTHERSPWFAAS
jgi:hypothetical protein